MTSTQGRAAATDPEVRFVEAARRHGENTRSGTARQINRAYRDLIADRRELRESPDEGRTFLRSLLADSDLAIVAWSALFLLPSDEADALAALTRVAGSGERLTALDAKITLEEWRAGRLNIE